MRWALRYAEDLKGKPCYASGNPHFPFMTTSLQKAWRYRSKRQALRVLQRIPQGVSGMLSPEKVYLRG